MKVTVDSSELPGLVREALRVALTDNGLEVCALGPIPIDRQHLEGILRVISNRIARTVVLHVNATNRKA